MEVYWEEEGGSGGGGGAAAGGRVDLSATVTTIDNRRLFVLQSRGEARELGQVGVDRFGVF